MSYAYAQMTPVQIDEFLQAPRFAILGTNRKTVRLSLRRSGICTRMAISM